MLVEYQLEKGNRIILSRKFMNVQRVDMSIECVLEGQMRKAFVDDSQNPQAFKIQVGPFFYFAGDPHTKGGQEFLESIEPYTLFMPSSIGWIEKTQGMYSDRMVSMDRYSF